MGYYPGKWEYIKRVEQRFPDTHRVWHAARITSKSESRILCWELRTRRGKRGPLLGPRYEFPIVSVHTGTAPYRRCVPDGKCLVANQIGTNEIGNEGL